ncbi:sulfate ABC transporter permease subunit CysT [Salinisphaera sp. Q1T1-3]|uniref:sulfate ABC transporter permease subunit CysT n=1 Tax=Salinisphaera sp. Q1T1-3 TaxID=2321229 RepID=UPI000E707908|nr:sulfate ABC transporter permease subunit CysT [Salinisphaera sp. Q1T1-3]RJS95134.1 sulfate ABC transporter permease subunit CysT [Salinisphaera sp. Q1T1-3]
MAILLRRGNPLPGFVPATSLTLIYLSLLVLIPLAAVVLRAAGLSGAEFWRVITSPEAMASYRLTFGAAFTAAALNAVFGFIVAWVLVRYSFPLRRVLDALIDLPFALPTAVAGIALAALYGSNGWFGKSLAMLGIQVAYTPVGVFIALIFVGLPFVVRTVQPVIQELETEQEEAAGSLGGTRWQVFRRVILPALWPAVVTGFTLALARGIGEYGSVIFIAGNVPGVSQITPFVIFTRLEEFDYPAASAIAVTLLAISLLLLLTINGLQQWRARREGRG